MSDGTNPYYLGASDPHLAAPIRFQSASHPIKPALPTCFVAVTVDSTFLVATLEVPRYLGTCHRNSACNKYFMSAVLFAIQSDTFSAQENTISKVRCATFDQSHSQLILP